MSGDMKSVPELFSCAEVDLQDPLSTNENWRGRLMFPRLPDAVGHCGGVLRLRPSVIKKKWSRACMKAKGDQQVRARGFATCHRSVLRGVDKGDYRRVDDGRTDGLCRGR